MADSFTQSGGTVTIVNSAAYSLGGVVDFDDWWFQGFTRRVENGLSALRRVLFVVCWSCMYSNLRKFPEVLPAFSFGIVGASRCYRRALHNSGQVPFT